MKEITLNAPAKLNLSLDIVGVRPDGYHLMQMVMQTINLYDKITICQNSEDEIKISCDGLDGISDCDNIAYKTAVAFFDEMSIDNRGITISIKKHIPSGAGMGGGSADGAGVLVGLNSLYETKLSEEKLMQIGEKVGADIPFCLHGGTALVEGIGEVVTPIADFPHCYIVVAKPVASISTKSAFNEFDNGEITVRPKTKELISAIKWQDILTSTSLFCNVFEHTVKLDEIDFIKEQMRLCGGLNPIMTGSGSGIFSIFLQEEQAINCYYNLCDNCVKAYICEPDKLGTQIILSEDE